MKITLNENLKKIKEFLKLTFYEKNATQEEVFNFLQESLKYIFNRNNLNINDYNIQIHFVSDMILDDAEAKILPDEKYPNKFDVLFNKKSKSYKCKNLDDASKFFSFVYFAFHEFSHIIQFIKSPEETNLATETLCNTYASISLLKSLKPNSKEKRLIIKSLKNHLHSIEFMDFVERDANKQALNYLTSILQQLIFVEKDEEFVDFLCSLQKFLNDIEKDNYLIYKKYGKINQENLARLKQSNCMKELNEICELINFN